tara:strand:+ start:166 stop:771 length:606 start_codon:yes stop_codon:yes gene_type:complete
MEKFSKKTLTEFSIDYSKYLKDLLDNLDHASIEKTFEILDKARKKSNKIFVIGNGGSASTASHVCNDFGLAALKSNNSANQKPFKVISLTDNNSVITALGNDNGYENIFIEQLKFLFEEGDIVIAISASGNSKNLVNACQWVKENKGISIGWLGFDGGKLNNICDNVTLINTPLGEYAPVEDLHLIINHILVSWMHFKLTL